MIRLLLLKEDTYRTCFIPRPLTGSIRQHKLYIILYLTGFSTHIYTLICGDVEGKIALNTRLNKRIHIYRSEHD